MVPGRLGSRSRRTRSTPLKASSHSGPPPAKFLLNFSYRLHPTREQEVWLAETSEQLRPFRRPNAKGRMSEFKPVVDEQRRNCALSAAIVIVWGGKDLPLRI